MNIDQWVSCISEAYKIAGKAFSTRRKEILLGKLSVDDLNKNEVDKGIFEMGVVSKPFKMQDESQNEVVEETVEVITHYFFRKTALGETFGPISQIKEKLGSSVEENYGLSSGPFINMTRTYWTYKIEVKDLFPECHNLVLSQVLLKVEGDIASLFFPTPGPAVIWVRQRKEMQRQLLEQFAPEIDIDPLLENNPLLGTYPGPIAEKVFNEKIWIRCPNHEVPQFLTIPNTVKPLQVRCPKCKISFRFPVKDFRWINQLPPHLHPQKVEELENLRQYWDIPEEVFSLRIISSPWAVRGVQEYMLAQFRHQTPQSSEKELWKKVLESRMATSKVWGLKSLTEKEIDKMIRDISSFEELCDRLIEFEEKTVVEPSLPDPFGIGAKIDEILLR